MNCREAREMLLEAAEGELPWDHEARLREHLDACEACRRRYGCLRAASAALRDAVPELAPARRYGTPERIEALMARWAAGRKTIRLLTWQRLVACAAAAAILASLPFIVQDVRSIMRSDEPPAGAVAARPTFIPVVLVVTGQDEPLREVRPLPVRTAGGPGEVVAGERTRLAGFDSPGLRVPVEHAFYDPDESSRWW